MGNLRVFAVDNFSVQGEPRHGRTVVVTLLGRWQFYLVLAFTVEMDRVHCVPNGDVHFGKPDGCKRWPCTSKVTDAWDGGHRG